MTRTLKLGLLALLLAAGAQAQTTTTYTGTIKDLAQNPVTTGQVNFTLAPATDSTVPGTGRFTPSTIHCNINADGTLSGYVGGVLSGACIVTSNTSLSPTGTSYRICIQPQFATPGSCFYDYALGGSKDISTAAPTLSTGPLNYGGTPGGPGPQGIAGPAGATTYTVVIDTVTANHFALVSANGTMTLVPVSSAVAGTTGITLVDSVTSAIHVLAVTNAALTIIP
jgi:hypothetical protein